MQTTTPVRRISIVWKLAIFVGVLVLLVAGALTGAGYFLARAMLREQIEDRLTIIAASRQALLLHCVEQQMERAALVASRTRLRQLLGEHAAGKIAPEEFRAETATILLDAKNSTEGFLGIWIVGLDGKVLTAIDGQRFGSDFAADPDFQRGKTEKTVGAPRAVGGGGFQAIAAAPVVTSDGRTRGVCMVLLDATPMARLLTETPGLGKSGEVVIATRVGDAIHYLLPSRSGDTLSDAAASKIPAMAAAIAGQSGFTERMSIGGRAVSAAYCPVGYRDWGLVARIHTAEAYAPVARLRRMLLLVGLGFLVVIALGSRLLATRFTRPVLALAETAAAVAAGRLDARVNITTGDELGTLGDAFNRMTAQLSDSYASLQRRIEERSRVAKAIREAVTQLSATSRELLATTAAQADGAKEQEAGVAETVATMQEVAHTASQSAEWAGRVRESAQSAVAMGQEGGEAVQESVAAMRTVRTEVQAVSSHIQDLAEAAHAIGDIIATVNVLADQTNILAVNAAIEAARAGEAGKGFSVVAREMRSLSDQSRKATAQVRSILADIQKATDVAVQSGERGLTAVTGAGAVVNRAGEAIQSLSGKLADNAGVAAQIAATARQQSAGIAEASAAMADILRVARQNVVAIGQAQSAAKHLEQLSAQLTDMTPEA